MGSPLDNFRSVAKEFRGVLLLALGASSLLPIVGQLSGLQPIWPKGVTVLTSLSAVVVLVFAFQFYWKKPRKYMEKRMLFALLICVFSLLLYFGIYGMFVFEIPTNGERTYLGCGWTLQAKQLASQYLADPNQGCPGQYFKLLEAAQYDSENIWTVSSLAIIRFIFVILWLVSFCSFSYFIATFVVYQSNAKTHAT